MIEQMGTLGVILWLYSVGVVLCLLFGLPCEAFDRDARTAVKWAVGSILWVVIVVVIFVKGIIWLIQDDYFGY